MKEMNNTGLLITDVQVAMFSVPDLPLYNGDKLIKNISYLLDRARSSKTPVIFVQHIGSDEGLFGKGKPTCEIDPRIKPLENEVVVVKRTPDSFHQTSLHEELQKKSISKLVIVGCQTEFCVDTTCRRAFSMGYDSILVEDAHSTFDNELLTAQQIVKHHNGILGGRFVKLKQTNEINFEQM
ncbi:Isochorismatase hydrolase [Candidatus Desulfosporosinus infrequens]|uniref:Isochorismatase hydrolase n=1 Tax=Candidatus Desulfosporosinus infrequens TaxID=2043169 RepID=A0A2U3LWC7_9FIRM|nr:Isochorismatase hydrolase [Candidatus Desulfosporosinus infrequens]